MKVVIIVQARMGSARLPGKILKTVLDRPLLEFQIERLRRVKLADQIVIATTDNGTEAPIVDLCQRLDIPCFRGSEEDVLARYHGAALATQADVVVRVTSDCPIIDPVVVDKVIQCYLDNSSRYDYVSNALVRSYPRGMDTEVFSFQALDQAFREATRQPEREHVTLFICEQPQRYRLGDVLYQNDQSRHRWTVDTPEDFDLIKRIIEELWPKTPRFTLEDALALLEKNPDWSLINAHVAQKSSQSDA
jgi:spore coat polysaccharide biosynthesis protein SpsF